MSEESGVEGEVEWRVWHANIIALPGRAGLAC